ncbi:Imm40 family immunity protein [Sphingobium subterraneum]|uniref:Immunity protein 40 domain-containing protein n=1 Tax=Sphingobium subterraneum TaxID=627688 RepID=A0A841J447_9SPHN|nr:Imm40 family immunity protein [Sphingobium subterraneum]MBB6125112.1 hypothetical protein [Sphingobium subterraneum]
MDILGLRDQPPHSFLAQGIFLGESNGIKNWALTRSQALNALSQLMATGWPILGGDIIQHAGGNSFTYTYENWHCEMQHDEQSEDFLARSIQVARSHILHLDDVSKFVVLVPSDKNVR